MDPHQDPNLIFVQGPGGQGQCVFDASDLWFTFGVGLGDGLVFEVPRGISTVPGSACDQEIISLLLQVPGLHTPLHPTSHAQVACDSCGDCQSYYRLATEPQRVEV